MDWNKISIIKTKVHESDTGYVYILGTSLDEFDFDDEVLQTIRKANWFFNMQRYGIDSRACNHGVVFYDVESELFPRITINMLNHIAGEPTDNRINLNDMNWNKIVLVEPGSSWYSDEELSYPDHMSFKITTEEWLETIRQWNQPTKMISYEKFILDMATHITVAAKNRTTEITRPLMDTIKDFGELNYAK